MRILTIAPLKSGIGATNISISLAIALKEFNKNVCFVNLNEKPLYNKFVKISPPKNFLIDFFTKKLTIENLLNFYEGIAFIDNNEKIEWKKDMLEVLIKNIEDTKRFDILIFDCNLSLIEILQELSNEIIFLTLPYLTELEESKNVISKINRKVFVILNMLPESMKIDYSSFSNYLNAEVIAALPYDESVQESNYYKVPTIIYKKYSKFSVEVKKLAANLIMEKYKEKLYYKILRFFDNLFKQKIYLKVEELS